MQELTRSDWISLVACVASVTALFPSFGQWIRSKPQKALAKEPKIARKKRGITVPAVNAHEIQIDDREQRPRGGPLAKALSAVALASAIGIVELVLFTAVGNQFGVPPEPSSMSTPWRLAFYSLMLIPGMLLLVAAIQTIRVFDD